MKPNNFFPPFVRDVIETMPMIRAMLGPAARGVTLMFLPPDGPDIAFVCKAYGPGCSLMTVSKTANDNESAKRL